jgi:hypothetical protein
MSGFGCAQAGVVGGIYGSIFRLEFSQRSCRIREPCGSKPRISPILSSANRTFLKLDMPRQPQEPGPEATLKRGSESVVAGLRCVDWSWTEDVETRTVCITADGVLLRFLIDGQIVSEARSVGYRPQPAELFQVPPGYAPLLAPEGGPVP